MYQLKSLQTHLLLGRLGLLVNENPVHFLCPNSIDVLHLGVVEVRVFFTIPQMVKELIADCIAPNIFYHRLKKKTLVPQ
jgi:hypothetical protein